ncbi:MAG: FliH/SctL family protein [Marmoricola sp.]
MSSSPDPARMTALTFPELRTGAWTRYGDQAVLGDAVTERTLSALAESTRTAAGSQGYAVGWAEGQRAAREAAEVEAAGVRAAQQAADTRRAAEHAAAVAALNAAAAQLRQATAEVCARVESQASELAWELTQELVGHELSGPGVDVVRRVLALAPTEDVVRVRLHPADLGGAAAGLDLAVVADPALDRGDALVELADQVLDLRLETALTRVREALR